MSSGVTLDTLQDKKCYMILLKQKEVIICGIMGDRFVNLFNR